MPRISICVVATTMTLVFGGACGQSLESGGAYPNVYPDQSVDGCSTAPVTVTSPPVPFGDGGYFDCTVYCETGFLGDDFGVKGGTRPTPRSCAAKPQGDAWIVSCTFPGC